MSRFKTVEQYLSESDIKPFVLRNADGILARFGAPTPDGLVEIDKAMSAGDSEAAVRVLCAGDAKSFDRVWTGFLAKAPFTAAITLVRDVLTYFGSAEPDESNEDGESGN